MRAMEFNGLRRVSKRRARALYDAGAAVCLCPVNMSPVALWNLSAWVQRRKAPRFVPAPVDTVRADRPFSSIVNEFEAFSCGGGAGRYAAYYVQEGGE